MLHKDKGKTSISGTLTALTIALLVLFPTFAIGAIQFQDVTAGSGIEKITESYGASWGDVNGDGWPDLFSNHHRGDPSLYVNMGAGVFSDRWREIAIWADYPNRDQHGGTWADFDNDGDQDLYILLGAAADDSFLVNENGALVDHSVDFGLTNKTWAGRMPIWFDYNIDGLLDFASIIRGKSSIFEQDVSGFFVDKSTETGFVCIDNYQYGQLVDLNDDGSLEIICVIPNTWPNKIYDVSTVPYTDVTSLLPVVANINDSVVADYDGDLRTDIFIVRGALRLTEAALSNPNQVEAQLIANNAHEAGFTFQSTGLITIEFHWVSRNRTKIFIGSTGWNPSGFSGTETIRFTLDPADPTTWGLVPHDPAVDDGVYIGYDSATGFWNMSLSPGGENDYSYWIVDSTDIIQNVSANGLIVGDLPIKPALQMNLITGFEDQAQTRGLNDTISCVSATSGDFDNDMDVDLYLSCRGGVQNFENRLYENQGGGTFVLVPGAGGAAGFAGTGVGVGGDVVTADYDADGFLDLYVGNGLNLLPEGPDSRAGSELLFRNVGNANHWIEIDLVGTTSNRDGIGAKVLATAAGTTQVRVQDGGYHRWSQNHQRIHFGLAGNTLVDIRIEWPSGIIDEVTGVPADKLYQFTEGGGYVERVLGAVPESPCAEPPYDQATEQAVFIWKDCSDGSWHTRMTAGGSSITYQGVVIADQAFTSVTGFSLENYDVVDFTTNPVMIKYNLVMSGSGQDGFDFSFPVGPAVCFGVDVLGGGVTVFMGSTRVPVSAPFDLNTLQPCGKLPPTISINNVTIAEDDAGGLAGFTVSLSAASASSVSVDVASSNGTATAPADYTALPLTTVTFLPGEISKVINVAITDDAFEERDETFNVTLSNAVNGQLGAATGTGTIANNEVHSCGEPTYNAGTEQAVLIWKDCGTYSWHARMTAGGVSAIYNGRVVAGQAYTGVTGFNLENGDVVDFTTKPLEIAYSLSMGGTDQDGFDFSYPAGTPVCFVVDAPGGVPIYAGSMRIPVTAPFDLSTLGTCTNLRPTVSINNVTIAEDDVGGLASFTVSLSTANASSVSVDVASSNGTATAPADYIALPLTTVTFLPGETSKPVDIAITDDAFEEWDETFNVTLSNVVNGQLGAATGTGAIFDNERRHVVSRPVTLAPNKDVLVCKDCGTDSWHARMTAGGVSAIYNGRVAAGQAYTGVTGFNLENGDVVDFTTKPLEIAYSLSMGGTDQVGFDFSFPVGTPACFVVDAPVIVPIYAGPMRIPVTVPFDLATLGVCI